MDLTMPGVLSWVLGGNVNALSYEDRAPHCRIPDKPKAFAESVGCCPLTFLIIRRSDTSHV